VPPSKNLFIEPALDNNIPMRLQYPSYTQEFKMVGSVMYKHYVSWAKSNGFHREFAPSIKQFHGKIAELQLPIIKYKNSDSRLKFVPAEVYTYLLSKKWISNTEYELEQQKEAVQVAPVEEPEFVNPFKPKA
jgi:hypothetical protein